MKTRRFLVDLALMAAFVLLGWYCYDRGKAYDFIVQNTAYAAGAEKLSGMEAVQLTVDGGAPKTLYDGDIDQTVAVGSGTHELRIDVLDLDDRPVHGQSRVFRFRLRELGEKMTLNIPFAYKSGAAVK
ncbi:MAG: hypothetical protein J6D22_01820 [Pyramidobacter sp.]|nr:hypothetical protein [Pyramidobacter sp.]